MAANMVSLVFDIANPDPGLQVVPFFGKGYRRKYALNFCEWCGKRIEFRLNCDGVPESSDKYNKRKGCCDEHSHLIKNRNIEKRAKARRESPRAVNLKGFVAGWQLLVVS